MENLCASDAMKMLPDTCEKMIHTTYNYITGSAGRLSRFKSLQKLSNDEDDIEKTVLRPVATRWLSTYYCTVRILRLWPVLKKFFDIERTLVQQTSQRGDQENIPLELYNLYSDTMMLIYQMFIEWVLNKFVKFNEQFQSNSSLTPERHNKIVRLYKFFLKIYMKSEIVHATPAKLINPCDQSNFLSNTEINWPDKFDYLVATYVEDKSEDMRNNLEIEISEVKENCKMFAKEAAIKIATRFDVEDERMGLLDFLVPANALSKEYHRQFPNLMILLLNFPTLMPLDTDVSLIHKEWQNLIKFEFQNNFKEIKDERRFWAILQKFDNSKKELLFQNLCRLAYLALGLPNSNAQPERIWSRYNFIKNKWRGSLKVHNVKGIIQAKEYIDSLGGALQFTANVQMFDLFNSEMYTGELRDDKSEGDTLLEREEFNLNEDYINQCKAFNKLYKHKERGNITEYSSDEE